MAVLKHPPQMKISTIHRHCIEDSLNKYFYSRNNFLSKKQRYICSRNEKKDYSSIKESLTRNLPIPIQRMVGFHRNTNDLSGTSHESEKYSLNIFNKPVRPCQLKFKNEADTRILLKNCIHTSKATTIQKTNKMCKAIEEPYYDRNFITERRAMKEFLLKPENFESLRITSRRSANESGIPLKVYWRKDVETKSINIWGSLEAIEKEKNRREKQNLQHSEFVEFYKRYFAEPEDQSKADIKSKHKHKSRMVWEPNVSKGLKSESGKCVLWAISVNSANTILKLAAWSVTGSHALFSEFIHSLADTLNQAILAYGIHSSAKKADEDYPYGYTNMQYVSSLISGVGVFCLGAGLSFYHGIDGLVSPQSIDSMAVAFTVLGISFASESITLGLAVRSIKKSASCANIGFFEYVIRGFDPCVNVVLLEDAAAVLGVILASMSMYLSLAYGSHIPDALGSIAIGSLLGAVATFMITTNSNLLIGRSIPEEKIQMINEKLEGDIMVRHILDVKGMDMGNGIIRYKAEVDIDGRELARFYLSKTNLEQMMKEVKTIENTHDMELFMLKHGENVVDCLGSEVDRIEQELKRAHPEIRHVDLEVL